MGNRSSGGLGDYGRAIPDAPSSAPELVTSNVSDAQRLSQSATAGSGAGTLCTALISQTPPQWSGSLTRPSPSDRALTASSGLARLMATTSTPETGLPS